MQSHYVVCCGKHFVGYNDDYLHILIKKQG